MDMVYEREEWDSALEAAELYEWDPIDAGEKHGPLAQWLADNVYDHDVIGCDPEMITTIFEVLENEGEDEFTPERLMEVLTLWESGAWRK